MKDFDGRFWLALWAIVAVTTVVCVVGGCAIECRHIEKMAELGYEETTLPGSNVSHWHKKGSK